MQNISGKNLKIGITFGCYIPLHTGHMHLIEKTIQENDIAIIGVTGYDMDRGRDFVPFLRRVRLMKEIYKNQPAVYIGEVDDKKLGLTGTFSTQAWRLWCGELFATSGIQPDLPGASYTWYTGEQSYINKIQNLYPAHKFCLADRNIIPLSGTAIRENPEYYLNEIHPEYIAYLRQNSLISNNLS